jgi:hypothetical protein
VHVSRVAWTQHIPAETCFSIATWLQWINNLTVAQPAAQGDAMKMNAKQFACAVFVAMTWIPLPAAAELHGLAKCANPSWNALVSGECGVGDEASERWPVQDGANSADSSTVLVADEFPSGPIVPEPGTYVLMLVGLTVIIAMARKRGRG